MSTGRADTGPMGISGFGPEFVAALKSVVCFGPTAGRRAGRGALERDQPTVRLRGTVS